MKLKEKVEQLEQRRAERQAKFRNLYFLTEVLPADIPFYCEVRGAFTTVIRLRPFLSSQTIKRYDVLQANVEIFDPFKGCFEVISSEIDLEIPPEDGPEGPTLLAEYLSLGSIEGHKCEAISEGEAEEIMCEVRKKLGAPEALRLLRVQKEDLDRKISNLLNEMGAEDIDA